MKTLKTYYKALATGLFFAAVAVAIILVGYNNKLTNKLEDEKLISELLLSEKLGLDKMVVNFQIDVKNLQNQLNKLNRLNEEIKMDIQYKKSEIEKLTMQQKSLVMLQKKINESNLQEISLQQKIAELNQLLTQAENKNSILNNQLNQEIQKNSGLFSDNSVLKAMISDNYRTEALRGKNEKLTVNANRTSKLLVSFDLPAKTSDDLYFKVVTPQGKEFSSNKDFAAYINVIEYPEGLTASASESEIYLQGSKRVEMTFKPKDNLAKGIYLFTIYNNNNALGCTQLRLK